MQIDKEVQKFYEELGPRFQTLQNSFLEEAQKRELYCLTQAKNQEPKYVDCMVKMDKTVSRQEKLMSFKMSYLNIYTKNCFNQALKDKQTFDKCKSTVKSNLDRYEKDAIQSLSK